MTIDQKSTVSCRFSIQNRDYHNPLHIIEKKKEKSCRSRSDK